MKLKVRKLIVLLLILLVKNSMSKSIDKTKEKPHFNLKEKADFFNELNRQQYSNYMREVFTELEKEMNISENVDLSNTTESIEMYINQLNSASSKIRTKLDDIKLREIRRLNELEKDFVRITEEQKLEKNEEVGEQIQKDHEEVVKSILEKHKAHIHDHSDQSFTVNDLKKLIERIQHDIHEVDKVQEREHRRNELKNKWKVRRAFGKIKHLKTRQKIEARFYDFAKKKRAKLHEPGSKEQFREIWERSDHLNKEDFNPVTFFHLHDVNQDENWDIEEVEALVQNEIGRLYEQINATNSAENPEKFHETMRMRQRIFEKIDKNGDSLISKNEFVEYTKNNDLFLRDLEWKTTEELSKDDFSDEDFKEFEESLDFLKTEFDKEIPAKSNTTKHK